jgi:hypothetical protein
MLTVTGRHTGTAMKRYHPSQRPGYHTSRLPFITANQDKVFNTGSLKCFCGKTALYRFGCHGACKDHKDGLAAIVKATNNKLVDAMPDIDDTPRKPMINYDSITAKSMSKGKGKIRR